MQKGYTIIEILVVLTIIGILFAVGYANFRSFSQRQAVMDAAKTLQGSLRLVQQTALSGEKPDSPFCRPPNRLNGYNLRVNNSGYTVEANCTGSSVGVVTKEVVLPFGINIGSIPSPNPITFYVLGNGTNIDPNSDAVIIFTQTGTNNVARVTVTSGGEIR